ncbi:putative DNA polymerase [Lactococcus phage 1358]|uniref:Putative DNA polymerase n=1 Tax=Lactococcus phage 1358 TaxID=741942 RepID=D3W0F9_9CAUD|nr:DNA polymerase [Lactococcus phage 1358]ADD25725.1 putative DNA polymerase [Lactococcus phage 1358]
MKKPLHIDIETFSDVDLAGCGVYRYAASPAFYIQLFSYRFGDEPVTRLDLQQGDVIPSKVLRALRDPKRIKVAHNAQFERVCIGYELDGRPLDPTNWRCTMVWGSCLGLPQSLDGMGKALGLDVQKDKEGKRLIQYFSKPCKPTKANGGRTQNLPEHAPEDWEHYGKYNEIDVEVETGISDKLAAIYELPADEWRGYENDQRINDAGVPVDVPFVRQAIKLKDKLKKRSSMKLRRLTGVESVTKVQQLKAWAAAQGYPVESLDKQHCEDYLNDPELHQDFPEVYRMIELYQEAGGAAVAKYDKIMAQLMPDGTIKGQLRFCGAGATARWAGKGVQVQNLPRVYLKADKLEAARQIVAKGKTVGLKKFGNPIDVITQLVRTSLKPPTDYEFGVSDYSAIEARVVAWFAGESWVLKAFEDGEDIYVATASKMYHVTGEEAEAMRQKGKQATLALGYQGGANALIVMGALRAGIPEEELPELVQLWRKANPNIVNLWHTVDKAARMAINNGGAKRYVLADGKLVISYKGDEHVLQVQLPSGRKLNYFDCKIRDNKISYLKGVRGDGSRFYADTYGGKLTENLVQATSRDLLLAALMRIEAAGIQTVFHVHDETINIVPEGTKIEEINNLMTSPAPEWADGLPLDSEGDVIKYYRKV